MSQRDTIAVEEREDLRINADYGRWWGFQRFSARAFF